MRNSRRIEKMKQVFDLLSGKAPKREPKIWVVRAGQPAPDMIPGDMVLTIKRTIIDTPPGVSRIDVQTESDAIEISKI
jgi:hypothetical protein